MRRGLGLFLLVALVAHGALAHELRPAYLEVRQTGLDTYDVLWKVPALGEDLRLALYVRFPEDCQQSMPRRTFADGAYVERWRVQRSGGLIGGGNGHQPSLASGLCADAGPRPRTCRLCEFPAQARTRRICRS